MRYFFHKIHITTSGPVEVVDISGRVREILRKTGVREGAVNVFTQHTTTAVNINEREKGLQEDMIAYLSGFVPDGAGYRHDRNAMDGRGNARAHLLAMLANASLQIPVSGGEMALGDWQSVFFIELDGPRGDRCVVVQVAGE